MRNRNVLCQYVSFGAASHSRFSLWQSRRRSWLFFPLSVAAQASCDGSDGSFSFRLSRDYVWNIVQQVHAPRESGGTTCASAAISISLFASDFVWILFRRATISNLGGMTLLRGANVDFARQQDGLVPWASGRGLDLHPKTALRKRLTFHLGRAAPWTLKTSKPSSI